MARPIRSRRSVSFALTLTFGGLLTAVTGAPSHASGTVSNCANDTAFSSALSGGGLVTFACGATTIALSSTKAIAANTTIDGGHAVTLSGGHSLRLFEVASGVTLTLKNIVLTSGYGSSSDGGAIRNAGHLVLDDVTIRNSGNSNFYGAAVATFGPLDVTNSEFIDNNAGSGGAIYAIGGSAVVTVSGSRFEGNSVSSSNPASKRGGAIYVANGAKLDLSTSVVHGNRGAFGSGIANENGSSNLTDVTVSGNEATGVGAGGGLHNTGTATLTRVTFFDNFISTGSGGGLFNKGTATLESVLFDTNRASYGGGIANDHGTLTVTHALFVANSANVAGGGGIGSSFGPMTVTNATFFENFASGDAGGVENGRGTATLTNVTFADNTASSGGGMWNLFGGEATLTNVTFSRNRAVTAGGIGNSNDVDTHLHLKNVIVDGSIDGDNCVFQKAPDSVVSSLSSDGTCGFGVGRDGVDVKLGKLGTNGGVLVGDERTPILTFRLLKASPAIDGGTFVASILTDERGITRPRGTAFDVGAVEYVPCNGAPTKPVRISPAQNATVTTPTARLDWAGPDCAKKFHVVVRRANPSGAVVFAKKNLRTTEVETNELDVDRKYVWQVTGCAGVKCTASNWFTFRTEN